MIGLLVAAIVLGSSPEVVSVTAHHHLPRCVSESCTQALRRAQRKCGRAFVADIPEGYWHAALDKGVWTVSRMLTFDGHGRCLSRSVMIENQSGHVSKCGPCEGFEGLAPSN